ncbi:AraC family transcriptional regulator [Sphingomonas sp. ASV193]|uniref:AraC family transcriptional regulator n=1 Tax=Sphingomonas sp. ASV193 TaxID=3144405 RepID=UPI0032E91EBB
MDRCRHQDLHRSDLVSIRQVTVPPHVRIKRRYERRFSVAIITSGLLNYRIGYEAWTLDSGEALLIGRGNVARLDHPSAKGGHSAVLLDPASDLIAETFGDKFVGTDQPSSPVAATMRLRLLAQVVLQSAIAADPLALDEWALAALREAAARPPGRPAPESGLVVRAKEYLHDYDGDRLNLRDIARAIGVTAGYLTQQFRLAEGIPLYRYHRQLRLGRALRELPHCNDITQLALELGFSSHSHFTSSFRDAFGLTPSQYRDLAGTRALERFANEIGSIGGRRRAA